MELITREHAVKIGLTRYFTGKPCKHGHVAERRTTNRKCFACNDLRVKLYKQSAKGKAAIARRGKAYYLESTVASPRLALRTALTAAKTRWVKRGMFAENFVSIDYLAELYEKQQGKCALTGISMVWSRGGNNGYPALTSMSLDRIDNRIGYVDGNVRLICNALNIFKGRGTDDEMYELAEALLANRSFAQAVV